MAVAVSEMLERGQGAVRRDHLSLVPKIRPQPEEDYDIAFDLPPELLIGDPLPAALVDMYFEVIPPQEFGFEDEWEFEEPPPRWKQRWWRTDILNKVPIDEADSSRVFKVVSKLGDTRVIYEAEEVLAWTSWMSDEREYQPNGIVRITADSLPDDFGNWPTLDTGTAIFTYENNRFKHAEMVREGNGKLADYYGAKVKLDSIAPPKSDIVFFDLPTGIPMPLQVSLEGLDDVANASLIHMPMARIEGGSVVMTHYADYSRGEDGDTLQKIELHAPLDIIGLGGLIIEEGELNDDDADDIRVDQLAVDNMPSQTMELKHKKAYKTAAQFPVSITTTVIPVR
jgi:hypothetical protein